MTIRHPTYLPGKDEDGTGNDGTDDEPRRLTVAADGEIIPIAWGRVQTKGKVFAAQLHTDGYWYIGVLWCTGEIEEIETVWADENIIYPNTHPDYIDRGVEIINYVGDPNQTVNSWLATVITDYTDDLVMTIGGETRGIAYSVAKFKEEPDPDPDGDSETDDAEQAITTQFTCTLKGLLVSDTGLQDDPKAYSTNPSLCLADFITSKFYGEGKAIKTTSVALCAGTNNESLVTSDTERTVKRRELNYIIDSVAKVEDHRADMQRYAACFYTHENGEVKLIPDRPREVDYSFDYENIVNGTISATQRGMRDAATSIRLSYTNTIDKNGDELDKWTTGYATYTSYKADGGITPWREKKVSMPGIDEYQQAYRDSIEQLDRISWIKLDVSFLTFDTGLAIQMGDVVEVTHPIGLSNYPIRVSSVVPDRLGRYKISGYTYSEKYYSDVAQDTIANIPVGPEPPSEPADIPELTGIAMREVIRYDGYDYYTKIESTWNATAFEGSFTYASSYWFDQGDPLQNVQVVLTILPISVSNQFNKLNVSEPSEFDRCQFFIKANGIDGPGVFKFASDLTPQDDCLPQVYGENLPAPRVKNTQQNVVGNTVTISWDAMTSDDSYGGVVFELQFFNPYHIDNFWDVNFTFKVQDITDTFYEHTGVPSGTYDYMVKAINVLGNYSKVVARETVTVP